MNIKDYVALGFLFLLIGYWFWWLFIAYPIELDLFIKKGTSYLYLPMKWKGIYKIFIIRLTQFFGFAILCSGITALWLYLEHLDPLYFVGSALAFMGFLFLAKSSYRKKRFNQQMNAYFFIRNKIYSETNEKGKKLNELEIDNLASFQHQNILRGADENGILTKAITLQNTKSKVAPIIKVT